MRRTLALIFPVLLLATTVAAADAGRNKPSAGPPPAVRVSGPLRGWIADRHDSRARARSHTRAIPIPTRWNARPMPIPTRWTARVVPVLKAR